MYTTHEYVYGVSEWGEADGDSGKQDWVDSSVVCRQDVALYSVAVSSWVCYSGNKRNDAD
uniref:Uncharacterized protein n=1 Tax=viral metagenome TaxID=1070528 RepID=A0A6C0JT08_9ZZZZ